MQLVIVKSTKLSCTANLIVLIEMKWKVNSHLGGQFISPKKLGEILFVIGERDFGLTCRKIPRLGSYRQKFTSQG